MTVELLRRQWERSAQRLNDRLAGLDDEEYLWAPAADCWTVHPDANAPGGWQIDYDWPPPTPLTTIAWRLVHLANGNTIYWEHAYGPGRRNFNDLLVPGGAADAVRYWESSREPITDWLAGADDDTLSDLRPSHLGTPKPAGEVMAILVDEQTHHGAEIALMRDLYLRLR